MFVNGLEKKYFPVLVLFIPVLFLTACASTGDVYGPEVAHLPRHFTYERQDDQYKITGISGEFTFVIIPSVIRGLPVKVIGYNAFKDKNLTEVILPENIEYIEEGAFANNNLTEIIFPETIINIGEARFFRQPGNGAFEGNQLTKVIIPSNTRIIGQKAFESNEIADVIFNGSILHIRTRAFANNQLTFVTLPDFVMTGRTQDSRLIEGRYNSLALDAFSENNLSNAIVIPETLETFNFIEAWGYGLIDPLGFITVVNRSREQARAASITIPSEMFGKPVVAIGEGFHVGFSTNRKNIELLVLPENLLLIAPGAFAWCNIREVIFPNDRAERIWKEYYEKQQDAERASSQQEYNRIIEQMRENIQRMDRIIEAL